MIIDRVGISLKRDGYAPADIHLTDDGNLALVTNAEAVGQHARQRLMTHEGEWFLDNEAGVSWLNNVLGELYDPTLAEAVTKAEILETDGVTDIESFSVRFDRDIRGLKSFGIVVKTEYDERSEL